MLNDIQKFHFIGIGGAGMSAIAKVLLEKGYIVSGSDIHKSETTERLAGMGARVFDAHDRANIEGMQAVVISTAIPEDNPELQAAREAGLPVFHRSDIVAALMLEKKSIAVAGAHGKTTTTSMTALVLERSGVDPTVIIGGELDDIGGNAKLGAGPYLVAEADESDGSFLKLSPHIAVVTNIEDDHLDYYKSVENIVKAFRQFLGRLPQDGLAVLCFDNPAVREIADTIGCRYVSYGIDCSAEFTAHEIHNFGPATVYELRRRGEVLGSIKLNVPGRHNVLNSLAAAAVGLELGLTFDQIATALGSFRGVKRRFQTKGRVAGIWVVDDYAHHPTEIKTTLLAARQTEPKRLICVFQPHRYTRTDLLREEFGSAFSPADLLILTDIYSAGEHPIPGVTGEVIKAEVARQTGQQTVYIPDRANIARYLAEIAEPGDLIMTMGAGNIYQTAEEFVERMLEKQ